jgi:hypothetical protein
VIDHASLDAQREALRERLRDAAYHRVVLPEITEQPTSGRKLSYAVLRRLSEDDLDLLLEARKLQPQLSDSAFYDFLSEWEGTATIFGRLYAVILSVSPA